MNKLPHTPKKWLDPITWKVNVTFILVATIFFAIVGWMISASLLSFEETPLSQRYSPWNTLIPIQIWMKLAVVLSLILPVFAIVMSWRWTTVRLMLLLYVCTLLVQIATESMFYKLGLPGINFVVGFIYTTYRIWQLWCYQGSLRKQVKPQGFKRKIVEGIFISGIVFWTINWLILAINLMTRTVQP